MLKPEIEKRVREFFPTGRLEELDKNSRKLEWARAAFKHLSEVLEPLQANISAGHLFDRDPSITGYVTLNRRSLDFWHGMDASEKQIWLRDSGETWTQLLISLSTVAPAYNTWYNVNRLPTEEEKLNKSAGYFRVDMPEIAPSSEWGLIAETVHRACHELGFECFTREERLEKAPFVKEAVFDDSDDDGDWDEDEPEVLEECTVWQCLF